MLLVQFLIEHHNRLVRAFRDVRALHRPSGAPSRGTTVALDVNTLSQSEIASPHAIRLEGASAEEAILAVAIAHARVPEEIENKESPFDFDAMQLEMGSRWLLNKPLISVEVG